MSINAFPYQYKPSDPIVDPRTGVLTRVGQYLVLALVNRTGKGTGIIPVVSDALAATGTTITDALPLSVDWNYIATVPVGSGVLLLPLKPGNDIEVFNAGANALNVYPPDATWQIDVLTLGTPYVLAAGKLRVFQCWTLNQFISFGN